MMRASSVRFRRVMASPSSHRLVASAVDWCADAGCARAKASALRADSSAALGSAIMDFLLAAIRSSKVAQPAGGATFSFGEISLACAVAAASRAAQRAAASVVFLMVGTRPPECWYYLEEGLSGTLSGG